MSTSESDIVLSAIRRGEETLPKLKAATGIDYARLTKILYALESTTVRKEESFEGFARYYPWENGTKASDHQDKPVMVPPSYNKRTQAAASADEAALEQRNAPYCVTCRAVCLLSGADDGRRQWRCWTCNLSFPGSLMEVKMAHIDVHEEGERRVREIVEAGGGELPVTNYEVFDRTEQVERPTCVDCGDTRSVGSGERCRKCYLAKAEAKKTAAPEEPELCWRGRKREPGFEFHRGMHRGHGAKKKSAAKKAARNSSGTAPRGLAYSVSGGGSVTVDVAKLRKATAAKAVVDGFVRDPFCLASCFPDPDRRGKTIGHHRDCAYWKTVFTETPSRVEADFEQGKATVASPVGENTVIERPMEIPKASIVSIDGFLRFNIEVQISVAEMSTWPSYKITDFWDGVRKVLAATGPDKPLR